MTRNEDAAKKFDEQMVPPFRQQILGRKLFAKTYTLETGKSEVSYDKITEMGPAGISYGFDPTVVPADSIKISTSVLKVPTIWQKFTVPRDRLDAFMSQGEDLRLEGMRSAYQTVALLEDDLLINGWAADGSTYDVSGLYQAAGATEGTSSVTSTFGNMIIKVRLALAALEAYNAAMYDFNLLLAPGNYYEVIGSINATYGTVGEAPIVKDLLANASRNGANVGIYKCSDLSTNTGLMVPIDPMGEVLDLVIERDLMTTPKAELYAGLEDPTFVLAEKLVPRIKKSTGICTLTGL